MDSKLKYRRKRNKKGINSNLKIVGYLKKLKGNRIIVFDLTKNSKKHLLVIRSNVLLLQKDGPKLKELSKEIPVSL